MFQKSPYQHVKMPSIRVKMLLPLIAFCSIAIFFWFVDRYDRASLLRFKRLSPPPAHVQLQSCEIDSGSPPPLAFNDWLTRKNYTRTYFRPHHISPKAKFESMEDIVVPVLPEFRALERGLIISEENRDPKLPCPSVIDVDVAADDDVKETSKFLFGLATTVDRLDQQLPALLYSYAGTKASILVLVPESTDDLAEQEAYFRSRGLDITIESSPLEFTARYFALVEAFARHIKAKRSQTLWVSFIDDDTFFPSLASVADRLRDYNPKMKHYIGGLSEASWQVDAFGHMAFGGAGIFVSVPLLEVLMEHYEECQAWGEQPGDQKLSQCIERFGDTPLTLWPTLYQMDLTGAPDGVFESGRPMDSLHHWGSWYKKDVVKMSAVAAAAGRRSVLRRWVFDQKEIVNHKTGKSIRSFWVLTNGYSIVKYTYDEDTSDEVIDFDSAEKTWDGDMGGFELRFGPMRPQHQDGVTKERWLLKEAVVIGDNVYQMYSREEDHGHSLIEVVWLGPKGGGGAGIGGHQNQW